MKVAKLFLSNVFAKDQNELMSDIMRQASQIFEIAYDTVKKAVASSGAKFDDILKQYIQYVMPFAESMDNLAPLYECKSVEEIKEVMNTKFKVNPMNMGTPVFLPDVIDYLLDGKDNFNVLTAKELNSKLEVVTAPIMNVMSGEYKQSKFSKYSMPDLQRDAQRLIEVSETCEDGVKVHIVAYEL